LTGQSRYGGRCPKTVIHEIVCQHRIEVAVWPAEAEVYFRDERYTDPANTQVRFQAVVYNAPSGDVLWEVRSIGGGPGAGTIDPTGLYLAPPKGGLAHGTTDTVVAKAAADPLRQASARVTLVGLGPEPPLPAEVEITPEQAYLYYPANKAGSGAHNEYIDASNKRQLFRATIRESATSEVRWFRDTGSGYVQVGSAEPSYLYEVSGSGDDGQIVKIKVELRDQPDVNAEARVVLLNYRWPSIP
jgi:hypothetical protein